MPRHNFKSHTRNGFQTNFQFFRPWGSAWFFIRSMMRLLNPWKDRYDHECILYSEVWLAGDDYLIHSFGAKSICQYVNGQFNRMMRFLCQLQASNWKLFLVSKIVLSHIRIITLYIPISTCSCLRRIFCCSWWKRNGPLIQKDRPFSHHCNIWKGDSEIPSTFWWEFGFEKAKKLVY